MDTAKNLSLILTRMEKARANSPAAAKRVELIAVSKAQGEAAIVELLEAGHRTFGENKVQEAKTKWPALRERFPDVSLHLIGSLQSNKAAEALELFDVIETVDRPSLVDALAKTRNEGRGARCKTFYVQVNIGEEPQKGGVTPAELGDLLEYCRTPRSSPLAPLPIAGLMCVPPADKNPAPYFALLRKLATGHGIQQLSMGMSGDFETAIRLGATSVRVGTALFGERLY